ncbi:mechanosensitive ion channel domain-containing protein [Solidesulfovibrio sp.]|uniref:mechanosensitive ion channel domain-containing protein n=1 Tax=Solidesulfovibrio sp. TaxID=2910990 RepID=UPI0026050E45|nr:mechanosensitive ion channel domain-containing protein [Solidesulfovibrio sp.]
MTPRRAVLALACALLFALAGARPLFAEDTDWELVLETLRKQDQLIHQRLDVYKVRAAAEAAAEALDMERLTHDRARLALWQATASDPWEIRDVLAGFDRLNQDVARLSQRPQQAWASLEQSVALLDTFKERLTEISLQDIPERFRKDLEPSRDSMGALSAEVAAMRDAIAAQTTPLRDLAAQIRSAEANLTTALAPSWKSYYTEVFPTPLSPRFLSVLSQDMEDWDLWRGLCLELLVTPHNRELLRKSLSTAAVTSLAVALLSLGAILFAARRGRLSAAGRSFLPRAALCVSVGVFFITLSRGAPFFLYTALTSVGEIVLTAALVHFTRLRVAATSGAAHPPVLWPTWRLFALGLLLETLRVPEVLMTPVLAVFLLASAVAFNRRHRETPPKQRLDRGITRAYSLLLPAIALVAVCGLPQTAILCASALFYITLALRFAGLTTTFLGRRTVERHKGKAPVLLGIAAGAGFPFFFLSYLFGFLWLLSTQFGGENVFLEMLTTETQVESVGISLKKLAFLVVGFYMAKAMIALSASFIAEMASRRRAVERGAKDSLLTINSYAWWGLYALFTMSVLGLSLTSVAVVAGGLSVGIGFGMQTMVNNFISGLILLFGRSIQAGDTIQLGDIWGVVREVNIRNTEVLTCDNATVFVPNSELISGKIVNWSHKDPSVRRDICVGVAYGSDTAQVRERLLAAAATCPAVLGSPAPTVLHWDFGASTLDFRLRVWLADVDSAVTAMCAIREAIDRLFREAGIEIAFPQADLHLRSAPALEEFVENRRQEDREGLARLGERLAALERKIEAAVDKAAAPSEDASHGK